MRSSRQFVYRLWQEPPGKANWVAASALEAQIHEILNETEEDIALVRSRSSINLWSSTRLDVPPELSRDSRIVIGVDEAGYGPNIGPMLVAGTAWRVPKSLDENAFVELLGKPFIRQRGVRIASMCRWVIRNSCTRPVPGCDRSKPACWRCCRTLALIC